MADGQPSLLKCKYGAGCKRMSCFRQHPSPVQRGRQAHHGDRYPGQDDQVRGGEHVAYDMEDMLDRLRGAEQFVAEVAESLVAVKDKVLPDIWALQSSVADGRQRLDDRCTQLARRLDADQEQFEAMLAKVETLVGRANGLEARLDLLDDDTRKNVQGQGRDSFDAASLETSVRTLRRR